MKMIYKIARAELKTLFYSPVAWLIIVIFAFQVGMAFADIFENMLKAKEMGSPANNLTSFVYSGPRGLFSAVQRYLYLYIPLLTMGLMSRELSSGSIKLLYSSPVTNTQIILGKFFSMMIYGLILMSTLILLVCCGLFTIKSLDVTAVLSACLGVYLLLCAYAAIGLFMSGLTSYQVVAAIGTFVMLAFLNHVGGMWQTIDLVRDITYWLSIQGRSGNMIGGLICSEDVLYFVLVTALFLAFAIIRLQGKRQKSRWYVSSGRYLLVFLGAVGLGYLTSRPVFWLTFDATHTKSRTLSATSQEILKKMKGGLTITAYANAFDENWASVAPKVQNRDIESYNRYRRFKPRMKFEYVYFYDAVPGAAWERLYPDLTERERMVKIVNTHGSDTNLFLSPERIREKIDLSGEENRTVRLVERENGERTFLRMFNDPFRVPMDTEIAAALKRLTMKPPQVGFLAGHGERDINRGGDRHYYLFSQQKNFRNALVNQGFDVKEVALEPHGLDGVDILVIADPRMAFTEEETGRLNAYLAGGGNLVIAGEPGRQELLNPFMEQLGVRFMPGRLVKIYEELLPDFVMSRPTEQTREISYLFGQIITSEACATMPGCVGLAYDTDRGFEVTPLFMSDAHGGWNELGEEIDFLEENPELNPEMGERQQAYPTVLALHRTVGEKEQRILVLGDADCLSNIEMTQSRKGVNAQNQLLALGSFHWLSGGEFPVRLHRIPSKDTHFLVGLPVVPYIRFGLIWLVPGLIALGAVVVWVRRRAR